MACFINRAAPHDVILFGNAAPAGDWKEAPAGEGQEAQRIPRQYRKMVADFVVSMDAGEIQAVDDLATVAQIDAEELALDTRKDMKAMAQVLMNAINVERAQHGRADITYAQFKTQWRTAREGLE